MPNPAPPLARPPKATRPPVTLRVWLSSGLGAIVTAIALASASLPAGAASAADVAGAADSPAAVAADSPGAAPVAADSPPASAATSETSAPGVAGAVAPAAAGPAAADPAPEAGAGAAAPVDTRGLDAQVQDLKKDVVDLNKDLFVLEEELLFPANTQVAVFVSMDVGTFFALDTIQLKVDNKEVATYLYTDREASALLKGGVQRLYVGNLKVGQHELVAFFSGKGPGNGENDRDYRRGASIKFEKAVGAKYLELKITDRQRKAQPEFEIKDWD